MSAGVSRRRAGGSLKRLLKSTPGAVSKAKRVRLLRSADSETTAANEEDDNRDDVSGAERRSFPTYIWRVSEGEFRTRTKPKTPRLRT
jgi:hypothetical protein